MQQPPARLQDQATHDSASSLHCTEDLVGGGCWDEEHPMAEEEEAEAARVAEAVAGARWTELTTAPPTSPTVFTATSRGVLLPNKWKTAPPTAVAAQRASTASMQLVRFLLSRVNELEILLADAMETNDSLATELLIARGAAARLSSTAQRAMSRHTRLMSVGEDRHAPVP